MQKNNENKHVKFSDLDFQNDINIQVKSRYNKIQRLDQEQNIPLWINLLTNEIEMDNQRQGMDIVMVVDVSGSMGGKKIKLVKQTLLQVLVEMRDIDRIAIICFNQESQVLSHFMNTTKDNKIKLRKKIKGILTNGGTNLKTPLEQSISLLMSEVDSKNIASIFFMSDGQDTSDNSYEDLNNTINNLKQNLDKKDFSINCFGFGEDHDEKILTQICKNFNGFFYYISKTDLIDECYYSCLSYLMTVIATKAKINVFLSEGLQFVKTYSSRWTQNEGQSSGSINVCNIISEMNKEFLAELKIPKIDKNTKQIKIAMCVLSFNIGEEKYTKNAQLILDVVDDEKLGEINQEVEERVAMLQVGNLLDEFKDLNLNNNTCYNVKKNNLANQLQNNKSIRAEVKRKINKILCGKNSQNNKHAYTYQNQIEEDYFVPGKTNFRMCSKFQKEMVKRKKKTDIVYSEEEDCEQFNQQIQTQILNYFQINSIC